MTSSTLFPPNFLNTSYIEIAPCNKGAISNLFKRNIADTIRKIIKKYTKSIYFTFTLLTVKSLTFSLKNCNQNLPKLGS